MHVSIFFFLLPSMVDNINTLHAACPLVDECRGTLSAGVPPVGHLNKFDSINKFVNYSNMNGIFPFFIRKI